MARAQRGRASIVASRRPVYGPAQRASTGTGAPGVPTVRVDLSAGTCARLRPDVAERYFAAGAGQRFEVATARAMCSRCPVVRGCLAAGIATYVPEDERARTVRAGTTAWHLAALHDEWRRSGASVYALADRELRHMLPPLRGAYGSPDLRAGEFVSPVPFGS